MFSELFTVVFIYQIISRIQGISEFRNDYTFNETVNGWLKLHLVPATWSDARIRCHAEGAVLASPLNHQILDAIVQVSRFQVTSIFSGVHSTYAKGVYTSIEGVPLSDLPIAWAKGQPDNFGNSENCLAMHVYNNGYMSDEDCSHTFSYVCYKKKTNDLEINACGTYDNEYTFDARTGKCYKFHRRGLIWPSAYRTCVAEGGHLAIINSDMEFEVIRELVRNNPENSVTADHSFFISLGFSDPNDGGSWYTIHGETLQEAGFERWQDGEPNNASQPLGELCGTTGRDNGSFYDAPCNWLLTFICEITPPAN